MKKAHTKKVQHEKRKTCKQHKEGEKSETLNIKSERNCNTLKQCNTKKVQNEKSKARRKHEN